MQAQLFAVSSDKPDVDWHTHSFLQVKTSDYVHGILDLETIMELCQDLLNNWDKNYPVSQFKPFKEFQGLKVNQDANWQIQKSQFNQVPLIEKLVKTVKSLFPHLSINQVWLLCKSTQNSGFQGWHQDIVMHMTQTIVINLGCEVNDDELEMGNVRSLPGEALCSSNSSELNEEREVTLRSDAILRKNPEE